MKNSQKKNGVSENETLAEMINEDISTTSSVLDNSIANSEIIRYAPNVNVGLNQSDVLKRTLKGKEIEGLQNIVIDKSQRSTLKIVLSKIFTVFNLVCVLIAIVIILLKGRDAPGNLMFLIVMFSNTIIGIIVEIAAKKKLDSLKFDNVSEFTVIREGEPIVIKHSDIVLDDIIILNAGQVIPCDAKIREGKIDVNESILTGEQDNVQKGIRGLLFSGTTVISGTCKAQVTAVGNKAYIHTLTHEAKKFVSPRSKILVSLNKYIQIMTIFIIIAIFIFVLQSVQWDFSRLPEIVTKTSSTEDPYNIVNLMAAIIGVLPAGLILLTSISMTLALLNLSKQNVLVQEMYCIENLARVDTICLDKTGTITDGSMTFEGIKFYVDNPESLKLQQKIANFLCATGDDNQTAMVLEQKYGRNKKTKYLSILPFSSENKYSAVNFTENETYILGAPEMIDSNIYKTLYNDIKNEAKQGFRVLLFAVASGNIVERKITGTISPICLFIIKDNIRPSISKTVSYFVENDVQIKVISGDNPITVSAIAQQAGIPRANKYISMENIDDKEIPKLVQNYVVFGRVKPEQKQKIVEELKKQGHTVAMTGDGVNDIRALKVADCSIAMGNGSQAAKNVSNIVLVDSDFSKMPDIVLQGRKVINNITKVATLFITKNLFCILILIGVFVINLFKMGVYGGNTALPFPMIPAQLALIDTLAIGIPATIFVLSPNKAKVKGNFFKNIFSNAFPAAMIILIDAVLIYILADIPGGIETTYNGISKVSTLITISTSITCFVILIKLFRPYNIWKTIIIVVLFTTMITFVILSIKNPGIVILGIYNFNFVPLDRPFDWMLIALLAFSIPTLHYFTKLAFITPLKDFLKGIAQFFASFSFKYDKNKATDALTRDILSGEEEKK